MRKPRFEDKLKEGSLNRVILLVLSSVFCLWWLWKLEGTVVFDAALYSLFFGTLFGINAGITLCSYLLFKDRKRGDGEGPNDVRMRG